MIASRALRALRPRIEWGQWGGAALSDPEGLREQAEGRSIVIQWLGLLIEFGAARVRPIVQ